ncbi:sigma-54 interaction domain-containing protein [Candidatus Clostridium radicumherbarum]|uniref:Sigma-54 interaction domain-containing protein n=1 Tax=Candidatus Clostridium radicumherbarum TaxID=3381662 RepID=A0ABW8TP18_9CLOT
MRTIATAKYNFHHIIGNSEALICCKDKAVRASKTSSPILIYGETGTGKELFIQAIHNNSDRSNKPFIAQNCAAIPSNLLEGILFGITKGAFTGAEDKKGIFELANGGTLYLDELNSMPIELQGKLLRVLQDGTVRRLGSSINKSVDTRLIVSLNEWPELLIEEGKLRKDLYYRLNVVRIDLPPLRYRKEDIPLITEYFIKKFNKKFHASIDGIDASSLEKLIYLEWQGNVRELEHVIEGVFNLKQKGKINDNDLEYIGLNIVNRNMSLKSKVEEIEKSYIKEALIINKYNISKAADFLQIPRQTLQSKIKKYNIHN